MKTKTLAKYIHRYWNFGEYIGSCGELSLCTLFRGWRAYMQEQQFTPREDEDIE